MSNPSALTTFSIALRNNNLNRVYANGLQQISLVVSIRKQERVGNMFVNADLSHSEIRSLELVSADNLGTANWFFSQVQNRASNGQTFRLADVVQPQFSSDSNQDMPQGIPEDGLEFKPAEQTTLLQPFAADQQATPDVRDPRFVHYQQFTFFVSTFLQRPQSFRVSVRLDNPEDGVAVRTTASTVIITGVQPLHIPAQNLTRNFHMIFDENILVKEWGGAAHWSLYATYFRFPSNGPLMLDGPMHISGGGVDNRRPFHNIFLDNRRHADIPIDPNRLNFNTYDLRRGYTTNAGQHVRYFTLEHAHLRVLQYYENPQNHHLQSRPASFRFLDQDGNEHRYQISIAHTIDVSIRNV